MKGSRFAIELMLTVLCLFLAYNIAIKGDPDKINAAIQGPMGMQAQQLAMANHDSSNSEGIYGSVGTITDKNTLNQMAQMEADRMISSGDISTYQKELEKSGLMGLMGH